MSFVNKIKKGNTLYDIQDARINEVPSGGRPWYHTLSYTFLEIKTAIENVDYYDIQMEIEGELGNHIGGTLTDEYTYYFELNTSDGYVFRGAMYYTGISSVGIFSACNGDNIIYFELGVTYDQDTGDAYLAVNTAYVA